MLVRGAMRSSSRLLHALRVMILATTLSAYGCASLGVRHDPPPSPPIASEPKIPALPDSPGTGQGRVVLDAEEGPAKVSRVTLATNFEPWTSQSPSHAARTAKTLAPPRFEEPLCVTPCAIDVRQGAQTFVFTSMRDPLRASTADVTVTSETTYVRHALGREGRVESGWLGGALLAFTGGGLALLGGTAATFSALVEPSVKEDGTTSDPGVMLVPSLVILGVGLAMAIGGMTLMANHRPVVQPGATTTWTKPIAKPDVEASR